MSCTDNIINGECGNWCELYLEGKCPHEDDVEPDYSMEGDF